MSYPTHGGGPIGKVTVTTASTLILAENTSDQFRTFSNPHNVLAVWLSLGVAAEVGKGIYLAPLKTYEMTSSKMTRCAVYGIVEDKTVDVSYQRGL